MEKTVANVMQFSVSETGSLQCSTFFCTMLERFSSFYAKKL